MEKKLNSNALRSKKLIVDAFLQLSQTKKINNIRIREILDISKVSKGTFYAHYSDIYALQAEIEEHQIQGAIRNMEKYTRDEILNRFDQVILPIFFMSSSAMEFSKITARICYNLDFQNRFKHAFVQFMIRDEDFMKQFKDREKAILYFEFIIIGSMNIIMEWYLDRKLHPFEVLASNISEFISIGINGIR